MTRTSTLGPFRRDSLRITLQSTFPTPGDNVPAIEDALKRLARHESRPMRRPQVSAPAYRESRVA